MSMSLSLMTGENLMTREKGFSVIIKYVGV